jgi:hypothetical protein
VCIDLEAEVLVVISGLYPWRFVLAAYGLFGDRSAVGLRAGLIAHAVAQGNDAFLEGTKWMNGR